MTRILITFLVSASLLLGANSVSYGEPVIPAVASSQLDPALKGRVLIEELNCVACHASDALAGKSKKAPRLADVGSRVNPTYLETLIANPHAIKPGTTMPDVMMQLGGEDRKQAGVAITHFLLSLGKNDFSLQTPDAIAAQRGERLFHSRGCAACHSPRDAKGTELLATTSTPLGALDKKYSFKSLVGFLRQPLASRPSGRMPDMHLPGYEVDRIAHYLLRDTRVPGNLAYTLYRGQVWEGLESENVKPERAGIVKDFDLESLDGVQHHTAIKYEGWLNIARAGRYTFFLKMNGGSLEIDGKEIIHEQPSDRRGVKQMEGAAELAVGWRNIRLIYFHTGHEPKFSCEMAGPQIEREAIPPSMLSAFNETIPALEPFKVNAELAARGRELFGKLGCANCHDDVKVAAKPAPAFAKLDPSRGCLSETAGAWPHFDLSAGQRGLIAGAMPHMDQSQLDNKQQLNKTLVTFNCIACHERGGLGNVAPERAANFTGTHETLGDQGRLPPPLTNVGAKLQPQWIAEVLLHGKRQREYLDASMPQFGEANVGHLVDLFEKVDQLETADIPKIANVQESKSAGCEMVGVTGLSCIACHDFNGQKSGGAGALDIIHETERVKKNWFHLYMRQPSRFHPTVIMPSYWPGGVSIRPNLLGGDAGQQIEAIWIYLEDGVRVKKPIGLSRQATELRVGDVAEICRGHSAGGYRSMGVGYPERINLSFDTEEMALRQLWKGEFANVDIGNFNPRGTDLISFPKGIPFHRLKSLDDVWPAKGKTTFGFPQDHGYQFRGYHLDAGRKPTMLYRYGDIAVEDFFEDLHDKEGKAYFKRTITFDAPDAQLPFYFRVGVGKKITGQSDRTFVIDQLTLRIRSNHKGMIREGPGEVLIPLTLPKGRSTLTLEYQW
jgi:mono/diheme cytochrome c family protein